MSSVEEGGTRAREIWQHRFRPAHHPTITWSARACESLGLKWSDIAFLMIRAWLIFRVKMMIDENIRYLMYRFITKTRFAIWTLRGHTEDPTIIPSPALDVDFKNCGVYICTLRERQVSANSLIFLPRYRLVPVALEFLHRLVQEHLFSILVWHCELPGRPYFQGHGSPPKHFGVL